MTPTHRPLAAAWLATFRSGYWRAGAVLFFAFIIVTAVVAFARRPRVDDSLTALVQRGDVVVRLIESGVLRPAQSTTYRSPLNGRESEIVFLASEGTRVQAGDLVVRLDTTELEHEMERANQALRQTGIDLQIAHAERQEADANLDSVTAGEGALAVDEARAHMGAAEKKAKRLRGDYEALKPLLEKGFITREELDRSAFEVEQAESDAQLAARKAQVLVERSHPRETQRAKLQVAQRTSQVENTSAKVDEAKTLVRLLREAIDACSVYARQPGLVVYEDYLAAAPRRKIRVGDRVTPSQGIVTIPEVSRMLVESSVREADVHRLRSGQRATIRVDAYPDLHLAGHVTSVGTLARASVDRPFEDKRFDFVVEVDPTSGELRPEMTARVEIVTGERKNVLLVPTNAVFERDGISIVHVIHRWKAEARQVELGQSSDFDVEVVAGLREGEQISLVDMGAGGSEAAKVPLAPGPPASSANGVGFRGR